MRLKLQHLKKVVGRVKDENRVVEALRAEVKRVLGPIMDTNLGLESLAEHVNDRIEVLTRTGRTTHFGFQPSTVVPFMNHRDPEVRSMAANLVPAQQLDKLKNDPHSMVRAIVAKRAEMNVVREMMRAFPRDEGLRSIYNARKTQLNEAGMPNAKPDDEEFDINGEGRLGDAVKQPEGPELSEEWYVEEALRLFKMYDKNLDGNWEEKAVNNLVRHSKATNGVEIDGEKLLNCVYEIIEDREDEALKRSLKELASSLNDEADLLEESMNCYTEVNDPVQDLIDQQLTGQAYLEKASVVFQVREAHVPPALKKYRLGERAMVNDMPVPMKARLPHNGAPRALDEHALDLFVRYWNERQQLVGEPISIKWTSHPDQVNVIGFASVLR